MDPYGTVCTNYVGSYKTICHIEVGPYGILVLHKIFRSINEHIDAQFTHVSRHPGAWTKLTVEMWSQICDRLATYGLGLCFLCSKKEAKHEFVQHLWRIPWQKLDVLVNFWDHIAIVSFLWQDPQTSISMCKFYFNNVFYLYKLAWELWEKKLQNF